MLRSIMEILPSGYNWIPRAEDGQFHNKPWKQLLYKAVYPTNSTKTPVLWNPEGHAENVS